MSSVFIRQAESSIRNIHPTLNFSQWSDERKILTYHGIIISKLLGYTDDDIRLSAPWNISPGLDCDNVDLSILSDYEIDDFRNKRLCKLCGHIPIDPVCCDKCDVLYCRNCAIYMQRLSACRIDRNCPKDFRKEMVINCLHKDQYYDKHADFLVDCTSETLLKLTVSCNRKNCAFTSDYATVIEHYNQCSLKGFNINVKLLSAFFDSGIRTVSIFKLATEYAESVKEQSDQPFVHATVEKSIYDHRFRKDTIPFGRIDTADSNADADPQPSSSSQHLSTEVDRRFFLRMSSIANGYLPPNALVGTIPVRHKPKPNTTFGLELEPIGTAEIHGENVSVVSQTQIYGVRPRSQKISQDEWKKRLSDAQGETDPRIRRNRLGSIRRNTITRDRKNEANIKRRKTLYAQQLVRFTPKLFIYQRMYNCQRVTEAISRCSASNNSVVAMDLEGQTLRINGVLYGVPGSVGIVGLKNNIVVHELIRWPKELLANPDKRNVLTDLDWSACQYGNNLAYVRMKVAQALLSADRIILHGQTSDIRHLFFTETDYELIRHKIRDIGAYYNIRSSNGSMSVQIATYLLFEYCIQGMKKHYAIEYAFWTLMLYYADMDAIEDAYEENKHDTYDNNGWTEMRYPPNSQMSSLYQLYQESYNNWPNPIRYRKLGKPRRLNKDEDENFVLPVPYEERRPPYDIDMAVYKRYYHQ